MAELRSAATRRPSQLLSVLRLLPPEAVLSFATTCRAFWAWASSNALWRALCHRDWGACRRHLVAGWLVLFGGGCEGERRKTERMIRRLEKQQRSNGDDVGNKLSKLREDLEYIRFFPKNDKYVSLAGGNNLDAVEERPK